MYRKGRQIMKTKKHYFIMAVVAGILCVPAPGEIELPLPEDRRPMLVGWANPTMAGIEQRNPSSFAALMSGKAAHRSKRYLCKICLP